jgi:CheY-like chemotaxis protein
MPELDGIGFLQVIRSYLRWSDLPVVILTAYADGDQADRARQLGVKSVFQKADYRLADLHMCVKEILKERKIECDHAG